MTNPVIATKDGKVDWMQYARWWPVVAGIAVEKFVDFQIANSPTR